MVGYTLLLATGGTLSDYAGFLLLVSLAAAASTFILRTLSMFDC